MASHQFAKLGGHRHCGNGYIIILSYYVTSLDQVIKGSHNFMEPIKVNYCPAKFGGHRHCSSEYMILVCQMIL